MTDTTTERIALDEHEGPKDRVDEGPGWRRVTPVRGGRYYLDLGIPCELWSPHGEQHTSISGLPWDDDFSGAARWMAGDWVRENIVELAGGDLDEIRQQVAYGAEQKLDQAADRGTSLHHYLEATVTGEQIDWDWIARSGAWEYLPAADAYLADIGEFDRRFTLTEVVVFGTDPNIAGTVDRVDLDGQGGATLVDYKTRSSGRHERRTKEATQLGGYADCLVRGYYVDARGIRRRLERINGCEVVTFAPDGTYATHPVDPELAMIAHAERLPLLDYSSVSTMFGKAEKSEPFDWRAAFADRLQRLEDFNPECKMTLAKMWTEHRLPRIAELEPEHYVTAARLFEQNEPLISSHVPKALATAEQQSDLRVRIGVLPPDLVAQVHEQTTGITGPDRATMTVEDLEDYERILTPAEAARDARHYEITTVLGLDIETPQGYALSEILGPWRFWTRQDLDVAYSLAEAIDGGLIECGHGEDDEFGEPYSYQKVTEEGVKSLAALGPKRNVTAEAKRQAAVHERTRPTKFDDVSMCVVTFAATYAALNTSNNQGE